MNLYFFWSFGLLYRLARTPLKWIYFLFIEILLLHDTNSMTWPLKCRFDQISIKKWRGVSIPCTRSIIVHNWYTTARHANQSNTSVSRVSSAPPHSSPHTPAQFTNARECFRFTTKRQQLNCMPILFFAQEAWGREIHKTSLEWHRLCCVCCLPFQYRFESSHFSYTQVPRETGLLKYSSFPFPMQMHTREVLQRRGERRFGTFTTGGGGVSGRFAKILADDHSPRYVLSIARHRLLPPRHTRLCFSRWVCMCLYAFFPSQLFAFHSHYWSFWVAVEWFVRWSFFWGAWIFVLFSVTWF